MPRKARMRGRKNKTPLFTAALALLEKSGATNGGQKRIFCGCRSLVRSTACRP